MKAALALLALAAPAADTAIGPPPYRLLPPLRTLPPGETIALPGNVVASAILGRPDSALLTTALTVEKLGQKRVWQQGTTLSAATVTGVSGIPERTDTYCEDEQEGSLGKLMAGQMLFGLVGMLRPTKMVTRFCLFDKDGDAKLDSAFLIGAKGDKNRAPFAITPVPFALISGVPVGGDSMVRLRYAGPSGTGGALRFDLELEGYGRMRRIAGDGLEISPAALPEKLTAGNAVLIVDKYDPATFAAHIRVERGMAPGRILIADARLGE